MSALSSIDYIVIICGILTLFLISKLKKSQNTEEDFYLASRKSSVFSATLAFVATEVSALTIVGVPSTSFDNNWSYLQFFLGSGLSRILIAYVFIPFFYRYECVTIYEFVGKRFSSSVRLVSTIFFFITRIFASGIRLYAACMTIAIIFKTDLSYSIVFFVLISLFFISWGGIRSVIANGVYQAMTFYFSAAVILIYIFRKLGFELSSISTMIEYGKFKVFNVSSYNFDLFFLAFLNGVFGSFASFGTDYEMMQKLLTVKTRSQSQKTILLTIGASFVLVLLYLLVGSMLYAFFKIENIIYNGKSDEVIGYFTLNFLPSGLRGFIVLTLFLATVDLPLVSLSTSFVNDIYKVLKKDFTDKNLIKITRTSMFFFAFLISLVAYLSKDVDQILWFGFEVHGLTSGSLLGVFLLGMLTKKEIRPGYIIFSMIFSSLVCLSFMVLNKMKITNIPWSLFVVIGSLLSFLLPQVLGLKKKNKGLF